MISSVMDAVAYEQTPTIAYGKPAIGKTGVHLRYHKRQEYHKLSREQRDKLREWRQNNGKLRPTAKSDGRGKRKSYTKKQLASLVAKRAKLQMDKSSVELKVQDDTKTYINVTNPRGCCSWNEVPGFSCQCYERTRSQLELHS
jgi:hypothetical protein